MEIQPQAFVIVANPKTIKIKIRSDVGLAAIMGSTVASLFLLSIEIGYETFSTPPR